jgi:hypothetical protein
VFDGLDDWEVQAVREGELLTCEFFRQTYPDDAALLLLAIGPSESSGRHEAGRVSAA